LRGDSGIGADAEAQSQHGGKSKSRVAPDLSKGVAQVLHQMIHTGCPPGVTHILGVSERASEIPPRIVFGFFQRLAGRHSLRQIHSEMAVEFVA
jgi:hypothetical protein